MTNPVYRRLHPKPIEQACDAIEHELEDNLRQLAALNLPEADKAKATNQLQIDANERKCYFTRLFNSRGVYQ